MCGIVGVWNLSGGRVGENVLSAMLSTIRYRGPDDSDVWVDNSIGLGHCRLSILDLSTRARQPFLSADGQGVLVYNGEVYNYQELGSELKQEGVSLISTSDTEVVLYALHRWGPERAIPRFNGMFALAYFDRRTQKLWLARDRLGIKPLYITRSSSGVVFGSEIKALLAHPDVSGRPDIHALTGHVLCRRLEGTVTPFEGIQSIQPGTILEISPSASETLTYFDVLRDLDLARLLAAAEDDPLQLASEFKRLFCESVSMHLVSDVPLAAMCSGGVDSSLMTAITVPHKRDIVAYVADVKGARVSEGRKAKIVARHLGIQIRQVDVDQDDYLRLWPLTIWHNDQPNFLVNDAPFFAVANACRRDGFKVVLTGEGSDELFGGYSWYPNVYRMWRQRRRHATLFPDIPFWKAIGRFLPPLNPLDLDALSETPFSRIRQRGTPDERLRRLCVADVDQYPLRQAALFKKLSPVSCVEDRAFLSYCLDDLYSVLQLLLQRNDRMGMASSIESRVPFLENRLIDFAIHLPRRAKYHRGITKWAVKATAEQYLPREIVHAPKIGFGVDGNSWRIAAKVLFQPGAIVQEIFKWRSSSMPLLREQLAKHPGIALTMVGVELWGRIFLRKDQPEALGEELVRMCGLSSSAKVSARPA